MATLRACYPRRRHLRPRDDDHGRAADRRGPRQRGRPVRRGWRPASTTRWPVWPDCWRLRCCLPSSAWAPTRSIGTVSPRATAEPWASVRRCARPAARSRGVVRDEHATPSRAMVHPTPFAACHHPCALENGLTFEEQNRVDEPVSDQLRELLADRFRPRTRRTAVGRSRGGDEAAIWRVDSSRGPLVVRIAPVWRTTRSWYGLTW